MTNSEHGELDHGGAALNLRHDPQVDVQAGWAGDALVLAGPEEGSRRAELFGVEIRALSQALWRAYHGAQTEVQTAQVQFQAQGTLARLRLRGESRPLTRSQCAPLAGLLDGLLMDAPQGVQVELAADELFTPVNSLAELVREALAASRRAAHTRHAATAEAELRATVRASLHLLGRPTGLLDAVLDRIVEEDQDAQADGPQD